MQRSSLILVHLEAIFREVVRAVTSRAATPGGKARVNAKGDRTQWFDLVADHAVCTYLKDHFPCSVMLLSEEGTLRSFGAGNPGFTMVLDPVDGSDNFARGIPLSNMAVALIPANLPIAVETVQFALVGDLLTGSACLAARGQGAWCNGKMIRTRHVDRLEEALISCELNHFTMEAPLSSMLSHARGVRAFGCATRSLVLVASGSLDAHLDLRGRLTPENFLAPSLILTEAGGVITDPEGKPPPEIQCLIERYSILAAGTPELHVALVQQLRGE